MLRSSRSFFSRSGRLRGSFSHYSPGRGGCSRWGLLRSRPDGSIRVGGFHTDTTASANSACLCFSALLPPLGQPLFKRGLGELGVFVFFGIIATAGSTFVQAGHVNFESWVTGGGMGLIACCALMANNIRDRDTDRAAGKRTLAVLMPQPVYRILYVVALLVPFVIAGLLAVVYPPIVLVLF